MAKVLVRGADAPVAWMDRTLPEAGPWLSRRVDPATGEGVRLALRGLGGLILVLEGGESLHGFVLVARAEPGLAVAVVGPSGCTWPEGISGSGWGCLRLGLPWGVGEPLFDRWATAGRLGRSVAVSDPGHVPVIGMHDAVAASRALLGFPGAAWSWCGGPTSFPALAAGLVGPARVRRAWLPRRWAGDDAARLRNWVGRPGGSRDTAGWEPTVVAEPAADE